jgi:hypothetical protein
LHPRAIVVSWLFFGSALTGCRERAAGTSAGREATAARASARPSSAARPAESAEAAAIPPTFETLKLVLTGTHPPCNAADCHGPGGPNILQYPVGDADKLYGVLTSHVSVECGNIPVVTPGHPERSALVKVLKGPCSGKVPQMPNGCTPEANNCLPAEYVAAIERWIALGAPKR